MEKFELQGIYPQGGLGKFAKEFPFGTVVYHNYNTLFLTKRSIFSRFSEIKDFTSIIFKNPRCAQRALGIYCKKNKIKFKYSKRGDCVKR
jgi:hypothetical protein